MSEYQESLTEADEQFQVTGLEPVLPVPDIAAATQYYRDKLGFTRVWQWGTPPIHGGATMGGARLQFTRDEKFKSDQVTGWLYVDVKAVDALYAKHVAAGVEILEPPTLKPWGTRQYAARDLNGYQFHFAEPGREKKPAGPALPELEIVRARPPLADYERLIKAVGWEPSFNFAHGQNSLDGALAGVIATLPCPDAGVRVIGCALLVGDGATFFYVKDVMVDPEYQNRGVGLAMMRELKRILEEIAPAKSMVGLYTGTTLQGFYARFGFEHVFGMGYRVPEKM